MRFLAISLALGLVACTSGPDFVGVYEVSSHTWSAEIEVGAGMLDCSATGHPVDDGAAYFSLVSDSAHADAVQYVRCEDPMDCDVQPDYAWYSVDAHRGVNAQATVVTQEFSSSYCSLFLSTFAVHDSAAGLAIDIEARAAYLDDPASCTLARARALASTPTCIWVEHLDGQLVP